MNETLKKVNDIEITSPFNFSQALVHLVDGLRVVDVNWGTGEWLEITNCDTITGDFIIKYNQGDLAVFQPDATAMLTAQYLVVK